MSRLVRGGRFGQVVLGGAGDLWVEATVASPESGPVEVFQAPFDADGVCR